jgi:lia operon protein LiaG
MKIKTLSLYLAIIMVAALAIGAILFVLGGDYNFGSNVKINEFNLNQTQNANITGINKILIEGDSAEINVLFDDSKEMHAQLLGYVKADDGTIPKLTVSNEDGTLRVYIQRDNLFNIFRSESLTLNVYLPKEYSDELAIKTASGNMVLNGATLKDVTCRTASGNIEISNLEGTNLHVSSASGDISINNCKLKSLAANSASGRIRLNGTVEGNIIMDSLSGNIEAVVSELSGDIIVKTASGNVRLVIPENSKFLLDYETSSGSIKNPFPMVINQVQLHGFNGVSGEAIHAIRVDTSSGDLTIEENK